MNVSLPHDEVAVATAQIAMFALPVVCLVSWGTGRTFSLDMDPLLIAVLALAIVHTCGRRPLPQPEPPPLTLTPILPLIVSLTLTLTLTLTLAQP